LVPARESSREGLKHRSSWSSKTMTGGQPSGSEWLASGARETGACGSQDKSIMVAEPLSLDSWTGAMMHQARSGQPSWHHKLFVKILFNELLTI
jgi:hypothetical protein